MSIFPSTGTLPCLPGVSGGVEAGDTSTRLDRWSGVVIGAPRVIFDPLHEDVEPPTRGSAESAGYDLRAYLRGKTLKGFSAANAPLQVTIDPRNPTHVIWPGERWIIPTGFRARVPDDHFGAIVSRSGQSLKVGLSVLNAPGVIDSDYPGEWGLLIENISSVQLVVDHGERVAQVVILPYVVADWIRGTVEATTDRTGGTGSTGTK